MNLTALLSAVRNRLGVPTTDALFTDAALTLLINAALHEIEVKHDWPWLEVKESISTANATDEYTPGSGWMRTVSLTISGRPPLERKSITELDMLLGTTGDPRFYGVYAEKLIVRPVPTSILVMTHRYVKTETDLASGSDTPLLPNAYHGALVALSSSFAFRRANQLADAGASLAEYEKWEERMLARADRLSDDTGGGESPEPVAAKAAR